jgi:hypothetical protein
VNLRDDLKQLKTDARSLRKFGLTVGGVLAALGVWFWLRHKPAFPYLLVPGALLMVFGTIAPRALKAIYLGWMALAFAMGFVVSHVLLTAFFYLVITPVGWLARLRGKDFLSLKLNRPAQTYWIRRPVAAKKTADYERQY